MHGILMIADDGTAFMLWHDVTTEHKDSGKTIRRWMAEHAETMPAPQTIVSDEKKHCFDERTNQHRPIGDRQSRHEQLGVKTNSDNAALIGNSRVAGDVTHSDESPTQ